MQNVPVAIKEAPLCIFFSWMIAVVQFAVYHVKDEHQRYQEIGHSKDIDQSTESEGYGSSCYCGHTQCQIEQEKLLHIQLQPWKIIC